MMPGDDQLVVTDQTWDLPPLVLSLFGEYTVVKHDQKGSNRPASAASRFARLGGFSILYGSLCRLGGLSGLETELSWPSGSM